MHVDIAPAHCFADASAECFRDRFFRREPGREMARWKFHRDAISNFALGENPLHETFARTIEGVLDALDLDHVHANANNAHRRLFRGARPPRMQSPVRLGPMASSPARTFLPRSLRRGAAMSTRGACAPRTRSQRQTNLNTSQALAALTVRCIILIIGELNSSCAFTRYNSPFARAFRARRSPNPQKLRA